MIVTQEDRHAFERDGYLVLDPEISEDVLDRIVDGLKDAYQGAGRIQDAWRFDENVKHVALAPRVLDALRAIYGREPLPFQTLNFAYGTEQSAHSDTIHFNTKPPGFMCGVWVALEDMDMDVGPLVYYPGSHKLPEYTLDDALPRPEPEPGDEPVAASAADGPIAGIAGRLRRMFGQAPPPQAPTARAAAPARPPIPPTDIYPLYYEPFIRQVIAREGFPEKFATIRKGRAFLWAANLFHGGSPRRDPARTRHSQVTHYFFEGCRYYTPLLSEGDNIQWRTPERIT
jgi:ectoine hydroxylase-related dioxygenase (phytanoyl-CoA dioxygenase family)